MAAGSSQTKATWQQDRHGPKAYGSKIVTDQRHMAARSSQTKATWQQDRHGPKPHGSDFATGRIQMAARSSRTKATWQQDRYRPKPHISKIVTFNRGLIWIQTVCKIYQQTTLVGKELNSPGYQQFQKTVQKNTSCCRRPAASIKQPDGQKSFDYFIKK